MKLIAVAVLVLAACNDGHHGGIPDSPIDSPTPIDALPAGFVDCGHRWDSAANNEFPWACDARCPSAIGAPPTTPTCHVTYPSGAGDACTYSFMLKDGSGCCFYSAPEGDIPRGDKVMFWPCDP